MILRAGLVGRSCLARACQRRSQIPLIHPLLPPPPISQTSRVQRSEQLLAQLARDAPFTTTTRLSFQSDDSDIIPPWEKSLGKVDSHMSPDDMEETAKANPDPANNVSETSPETTPVPSSLGPEEIERNYASTAEPGVASHTFNAADRDNQVPQLEPYRFAERGGKLAWGPGHRGNWLDSWEARFRPLYRALKSGRAYSRMLADVEDFPDWGKTEMLFEAAEIEQGEFKERHCGFGNVDEYMAKWMDSMLYLLRYDPELAPKFLRATFEGFLTPRWAVNDTVEFLAKWCSLSRSSKKTTHELAETIRHILRTRTLYMLEFTQQTLFLLTRDMEAEALWNLYRDLLQYAHPLHPYTWYTIARRLSRDPRYKSRALDLLEEAITSGELHGDAPLTMMLSTCILDFQGVEDGHLEQLGRLRRELTTRLLNLITPNKYTYSVMVRGMRATGDYQGAWTIYQIMIDQGIEPEQFIFSNLLNVAKRTNTIEPVLQTLEELVPEALKSRHIWNDIIDSVLVISRQHDLQLKEEGQRNAHAALTFRALLLVYARFYRYKELQSLIPVRLGPPYETKEQVFATATSDMDVVFLRKIDLILERLPERVEKPAVPGSDVISIMLRGYTRAVWKAGEVISFYKRLRAKLMQGQYTVCQICREQDSRVHDAILGSLLKIPKWNNVAWAPAENSKRAAESRDALQAGFGILEDMIEGAMCAERVLKEEEEEELLAKRMADDDSPADEEAVRTIESVLPSQEDAVLSEQEPLLIEGGDGLPTEDSAAQDIMTEEHILVEEHPPPEEEHRPAEEDYLAPSEENLPTKDYLSPSEENLSTEVNLPTEENLPAQDGLPVKDDLPVEEQYLPAEEDLSVEESLRGYKEYLQAEEDLPAGEDYLPPPEAERPATQEELQPTEDEAQEEPLLTTDQPQEPTEPPPLSEPSKPSPPEQPRQSAPSPQQLLPLLDPDLVTPLHPAPRPGAGWPSFKAQQAQWAAFHKEETYLYSMSPAPTIYTFNILLSGVIRASRSITNVKDCIKQAEDWIKYLADHNLQPNYHTWAILVRNWSRQQRPGAVAWAMKKMEEAGFRANNKMMEELQLLRDKERAWRELERLMEEDLGREKERGGEGWEREEGWERLGRIVKEQEERRRKLEFELVVEDEMYGNEVYRDGKGGEKEESDWDMFVKRVEEDRKGEEREKREGGGGEATF